MLEICGISARQSNNVITSPPPGSRESVGWLVGSFVTLAVISHKLGGGRLSIVISALVLINYVIKLGVRVGG